MMNVGLMLMKMVTKIDEHSTDADENSMIMGNDGKCYHIQYGLYWVIVVDVDENDEDDGPMMGLFAMEVSLSMNITLGISPLQWGLWGLGCWLGVFTMFGNCFTCATHRNTQKYVF